MRGRRKALGALTLCLSLLLSGCEGLWGNYRAIERLLVVETMGFDEEMGSVRLSLASAGDAKSGKAPRLLTAAGATISNAMERAFNYSYEKELFCYHVDNILIGEAAAEEGLEDILAYICQSPFMRIDVPLFVIREGTAADAVTELGEGSVGVSEIMMGALERLKSRGGGTVFSAADVMRDSLRSGSALICAVSCSQSSESATEGKAPEETAGKAAAAFGYAVIRDGKLCAYIEPEDTPALGLMLNDPGVAQLQVRDSHGHLAVLETDSGSSELSPVWSSEGVLESVEIRVQVRASVLELSGRDQLGDAQYADYLTAQLEKQLLERINSLLDSSKKLRADFMGLGERISRESPEQYAQMSMAFYDALPSLNFTVTVSGELSHTNDMKDD